MTLEFGDEGEETRPEVCRASRQCLAHTTRVAPQDDEPIYPHRPMARNTGSYKKREYAPSLPTT